MPDKNGRMTDSETALVKAFAEKHWINHSCPVCHTDQWDLVDRVLSLPVMMDTAISSTSIPAVVFVCQKCAYIRFHAAVNFGLTDFPGTSSPATEGE